MNRLFTSCLLLLAGCKTKPEQPANTLKLKTFFATTDRVVIKHFYEGAKLIANVPADDLKGQVTSRWQPGYVDLGPVMVEEANHPEVKIKGARIEAKESKWTVSGGFSAPQSNSPTEGTNFLDEDELEPLSKALTFMSSSAASWKKNTPTEPVQLMFVSRDGFTVSVDRVKDPAFVVDVGRASLEFTPDQVAKFKDQLDQCIQRLKEH